MKIEYLHAISKTAHSATRLFAKLSALTLIAALAVVLSGFVVDALGCMYPPPPPPPPLPVAVIEMFPDNPTKGGSATFDGTDSYDINGKAIVAYIWTFSRETPAPPVSLGTFTTPTVMLTFADGGTYKALLRVQNSSGQWSPDTTFYFNVCSAYTTFESLEEFNSRCGWDYLATNPYPPDFGPVGGCPCGGSDNPVGLPNSSFLDACIRHTLCYRTCTNKSECDSRFYNDMFKVCDNNVCETNPDYCQECKDYAYAYYECVLTDPGIDLAYQNDRPNVCVCCDGCDKCPVLFPTGRTPKFIAVEFIGIHRSDGGADCFPGPQPLNCGILPQFPYSFIVIVPHRGGCNWIEWATAWGHCVISLEGGMVTLSANAMGWPPFWSSPSPCSMIYGGQPEANPLLCGSSCYYDGLAGITWTFP